MTRRQIHVVAVIGAGISGFVSAAHLLAAGIDVTVFERNPAAGGVWLYDERKPLEPVYPSVQPSRAEQYADAASDIRDKRVLEHAPPGPCYEGLRNNSGRGWVMGKESIRGEWIYATTVGWESRMLQKFYRR